MTAIADALPRPVAFVMGGGASLGAVQVGMVAAVTAAGIRPDLIVGTSVGALNGAILAADPDPDRGAQHLTDTWLQLHRRDVFPGNVFELVWRLAAPRHHHEYAVPSAGLQQLIEQALTVSRFEQLATPLAAVALDLTTGDPVVMDSGPLVPAVLASAAIPGVYPAVTIGGSMLVDGGMVANVPVRQALDRGAASVIVFDCTVPAPPAHGTERVGELLARVSQVQMRTQLKLALPTVAAEIPVVYLPAPAARRVSPLEFGHTAALMQDAELSTGEFLATVRAHGPGIYGDPYERYLGSGANHTSPTQAAISAAT